MIGRPATEEADRQVASGLVCEHVRGIMEALGCSPAEVERMESSLTLHAVEGEPRQWSFDAPEHVHAYMQAMLDGERAVARAILAEWVVE